MKAAEVKDRVVDGTALISEYVWARTETLAQTEASRRAGLIAFVVKGEPVPLARARVVKGHAFTPAKSAQAKKLVALVASVYCKERWTGPIALTCRVFTKNLRRGDLDNYVKLASDALQGVAFDDDRQVVEIAATMAVDARNPRLEIEIRRRA